MTIDRLRGAGRSHSIAAAIATAIAAGSLLLLPSCRDEAPQSAPRDTTAARPTPASPESTVRLDSAAHGASDTASRAGASRWTAPPTPAVQREQAAVLDAVNRFFGTIDAGDAERFRGMLSARSLDVLASMEAEKAALPIAREALGSIRDRRLRFLGGTADSVALLLSGNRTEADSVVREDLIVSLLRENGTWKIMYPGVQHLDEHVGP
jgi:hypothetical protein